MAAQQGSETLRRRVASPAPAAVPSRSAAVGNASAPAAAAQRPPAKPSEVPAPLAAPGASAPADGAASAADSPVGAATEVLAAAPQRASATAGPKFGRAGSVYALEPDSRWLRPSWAFPLFGGAWCLELLLCCFLEPSFETLRLCYSAVAILLLLYRVYYYARKEWVLYFIDLCFVNSILLIWSLWRCTEGRCSQEWQWAVFIVAQGPVAGATFPLQTPLTLHHPEAFESFFMHASPMWICYAVRWRWHLVEPVPSFGALLRAGFCRIYLPWVLAYTVFLLSQPLMPDLIAGYETLMDGFLFPGSTSADRLVGKRKGFAAYAPKVLAAVCLHSLLSASGFAAAALSFQYHAVQAVWIVCVLLGCMLAGFRFYYQSAHPDYTPPGVMYGFLRMAVAWGCILPTYLLVR